jgi:hypothetical protein
MPSKNDALKELAKRNPYTENVGSTWKISTQKVLVNAGLQPI